ncbi:hypothetical protein ILYODFUR_013424 [Ilyodon furcidens]|uniref:Uncharacterized protein n=1 Tax=Ilyodon furcidens TaxID=33524 RepID=A0ABV0TIA0_9TELE
MVGNNHPRHNDPTPCPSPPSFLPLLLSATQFSSQTTIINLRLHRISCAPRQQPLIRRFVVWLSFLKHFPLSCFPYSDLLLSVLSFPLLSSHINPFFSLSSPILHPVCCYLMHTFFFHVIIFNSKISLQTRPPPRIYPFFLAPHHFSPHPF